MNTEFFEVLLNTKLAELDTSPLNEDQSFLCQSDREMRIDINKRLDFATSAIAFLKQIRSEKQKIGQQIADQLEFNWELRQRQRELNHLTPKLHA